MEQKLNAARFLNIEKMPACHTMMKNTQTSTLNFEKNKSRDIKETLLPTRPFQTDYDKYVNGKEYLMKKLIGGAIEMKKNNLNDSRGCRNSIVHVCCGATAPPPDMNSFDNA